MGGLCSSDPKPVPTQTTVNSSSNIPPWVSEAGQGLFHEASQLARNPYQPYGGQRIADFSGDEQSGFQAGRENVGSYGGGLDRAGSYLGRAGGSTYQPLNVGSTYQPLNVGSTYQPLNVGSTYAPLNRGAKHLGDKMNDPMARGWLERSAEEFDNPQAQGWLERSAREWDEGAADQYMNPYTTRVTDMVKGRAQEDFDRAQLGRNTEAVRAGAFGGSRHGVLDAEAGKYHGRNLSDIDATGLHRAYETAGTRFDADRGAAYRGYSGALGAYDADRSAAYRGYSGALSGYQAEQGAAAARHAADTSAYSAESQRLSADQQAKMSAYGLEGGRLEADRRAQMGAYGLEGGRLEADRRAAMDAYGLEGGRQDADRAAAFAASRGYAELGQLTSSLGQRDVDNLMSQGALQRGQEQRHMDTAYQDFLSQRQHPYEQVNYASGVLSGTPYRRDSTQTTSGTQYQQQPSMMGQLAGLGMAGAGIYNSLK